ncbi:MAG: ribosomal protein S18 [uncultured bacterium]|nr:MAG: ribosomal protein S18 [uncultured bacterium]
MEKRITSVRNMTPPIKKVCVFCKDKTLPSFTDAAALRRFLSDRGKIINKSRSGVCSKHQRVVALEIKRARQLSLLPFTLRV